eukprot:9363228-Karenia_brevis.AAC.1
MDAEDDALHAELLRDVPDDDAEFDSVPGTDADQQRIHHAQQTNSKAEGIGKNEKDQSQSRYDSFPSDADWTPEMRAEAKQ